jgi:hypothetical protein
MQVAVVVAQIRPQVAVATVVAVQAQFFKATQLQAQQTQVAVAVAQETTHL